MLLLHHELCGGLTFLYVHFSLLPIVLTSFHTSTMPPLAVYCWQDMYTHVSVVFWKKKIRKIKILSADVDIWKQWLYRFIIIATYSVQYLFLWLFNLNTQWSILESLFLLYFHNLVVRTWFISYKYFTFISHFWNNNIVMRI